MTTLTQKKRELVENEAKCIGYEKDRWGHWQKEVGETQYRLKFQKTSLRYETRCASKWCLIRSDYYKNIIIDKGLTIKGRCVR